MEKQKRDLGKITLIDNISGKYSFIDKNGKPQDEIFEVFKLEQRKDADIEIKHFTKFGGAMSPYRNGEKDGTLRITDSLLKLNTIKGYVESILLHELSDHDDNENSMLDSEKFVIDTTKESDLTQEEKEKILEYHKGFFQSAKEFYEEMEDKSLHYEKICGVAKYLESVKI